LKVRRFLELLKEYEMGSRLGFSARPDDSGIRSKGVNKQPVNRGGNYPYDKDVFYGQPTAYDRGSGASGPLNRPLTPKDDRHFSLKILGTEDEIDEVSGSPINLMRGNSSQRGSSVPGSSGGWAVNPPKDWDYDEGMVEDFEVLVPDIKHEDDYSYRDFLNSIDEPYTTRDGSVELVDPKDFGQPDAHIIGPDPWGAFNNRITSRGLYGLMPKESAWDRTRGLSLKKNNSID
jgi:hypothetical protein